MNNPLLKYLPNTPSPYGNPNNQNQLQMFQPQYWDNALSGTPNLQLFPIKGNNPSMVPQAMMNPTGSMGAGLLPINNPMTPQVAPQMSAVQPMSTPTINPTTTNPSQVPSVPQGVNPANNTPAAPYNFMSPVANAVGSFFNGVGGVAQDSLLGVGSVLGTTGDYLSNTFNSSHDWLKNNMGLDLTTWEGSPKVDANGKQLSQTSKYGLGNILQGLGSAAQMYGGYKAYDREMDQRDTQLNQGQQRLDLALKQYTDLRNDKAKISAIAGRQ